MAEVSPEVTRDIWAQLTNDPRKPYRSFGYSSSTVCCAVARLVELGYIVHEPKAVNAIAIIVPFRRI